MAQAPLRRCNKPGCRELVRQARCEKHTQREPTTRAKREHDAAIYNYQWEKLSKRYRMLNPLCVHCLYYDRIRAAEAVDHIIPIKSVPELRMEWDNLCSICWSCHNRKTKQEPQHGWTPRADRLVLCGLRATGKTTLGKTLGLPLFDADDYGMAVDTIPEEVRRVRSGWIKQHQNGPMCLIVSHPTTAATIAAQVSGSVRHVTLDETTRCERYRAREAARGY